MCSIAAARGEERRPCCTPDDVTGLPKPDWWVYLNRDVVHIGQTGHPMDEVGLRGGKGQGERDVSPFLARVL